MQCLTRAHIPLNDEILANLSIWEPRTFRSLVAVASQKAMQSKDRGGLEMEPCGPRDVFVTERI